MRFSSPGLVFIHGEALGAILRLSEQGCTSSLSALSFIQVFWFLISNRPSSQNRGTVSRTQTGLFKYKHSNLINSKSKKS